MSRRSTRALVAAAIAGLLVLGAVLLFNRAPDSAAAVDKPAPAASESDSFRTTSPLFEADWLSSEEARCPEGTNLRGAPPPEGNEVWCARPDGSRHGQHIHWQSNGRKAFERRYKDGTLHGYWAEWQISGKPWTVGQYLDGKRHGRWMRWGRDGKIEVKRFENGILLGQEQLDELALTAAEGE